MSMNDKKCHPYDAVDFAVIEKLEADLNALAVSRRCLLAMLNLSVEKLTTKVADSEGEALDILLELSQSSAPIVDNMTSYLQCLEIGQARLRHALSEKGHLNLGEGAQI